MLEAHEPEGVEFEPVGIGRAGGVDPSLSESRLSAKLLMDYYVDLTPAEEIDSYKARIARAANYRDPGTGRPTKRDRRMLDDFMGDDE